MHLDFYGGFFRFFSFQKKKSSQKKKASDFAVRLCVWIRSSWLV